MSDRSDLDQELEFFFQAGRATAPVPSALLRERILADAVAEQPRPAVAAPRPRSTKGGGRPGFWHLFIPGLGGPGVMAGLAVAMIAGAWIGFVQPAPIAGLTQQVTGSTATLEQVDLIPDLSNYLGAASGE